MTAYAVPVATPLATQWHGVDLRWAYADLLRGIHRQTGCLHRAYDVLHDALIRLALIDGRSKIEQPHAYLRTVVSSVLIRRYQEEARWVPLPEAGDGEAAEPPLAEADYAPSAEHMAHLRESLAAIQRLLDNLSPARREVFWLFRVEGYSYKEIAAQRGTQPKTIENQITRALIELRQALEQSA